MPGLWLPTGRVVACDPLAYSNPQLFTRTCPPGRYSVYLHLLLADGAVPNLALRYSGGFVIGRERTTYTLSPTGQLGPAITCE